VQNGRIYIELVNAPFLRAGGSAGEFRAGIDRAIAKGWLIRHESGTYLRFTEAGAALFVVRWGRSLKSGRPLPNTSNCLTEAIASD
jgi:hypothetical protein